MNIIIDAMGGDNAPAEVLKGAADAVREYGVAVTAVARKLCRIVFAVMRDQVPYDPGRE